VPPELEAIEPQTRSEALAAQPRVLGSGTLKRTNELEGKETLVSISYWEPSTDTSTCKKAGPVPDFNAAKESDLRFEKDALRGKTLKTAPHAAVAVRG
jgi:hypothetical protein